MYFSDVLDLHDSFSTPESRADILGDGFLLHCNPIYRKVREASLMAGCRYVEVYPEYLLLPFNELPQILKTKKVPYVPAARLMKEIERVSPGVFSVDEMRLPESYHMHEAAHVIADQVLRKIRVANEQEEILSAMMAESFANTVDALACMHASDEAHHFFLRQNCYMHPRKEINQTLNRLSAAMGFEFVFKSTFFSYLHANFLTKPMSKMFIRQLLERYALKGKLTARLEKDMRTIRGIGERLDPLFRVTTTANYFKARGHLGDIQDLLNFDFLRMFEENPKLRASLEKLFQALN